MLPALCWKKISYVIAIVIIINSCKIQFSHQQHPPQYEYTGAFNNLDQFNANSHSGLNNKHWLHPGQELVFVTTTSAPVVLRPGQELVFITTTSRPHPNSIVYVNNKPTVATLAPFIPAATTPTPEFLYCLIKCPTTSEFNPICASNRQMYENEQKFNCAKKCGADIQIVRHSSCAGLFAG